MQDDSVCYDYVPFSKRLEQEKPHLCEIVKCRNYGCEMELHQCKLLKHEEVCHYRNAGFHAAESNFRFNFLQSINTEKLEETKKALTKISAGVSSTLSAGVSSTLSAGVSSALTSGISSTLDRLTNSIMQSGYVPHSFYGINSFAVNETLFNLLQRDSCVYTSINREEIEHNIPERRTRSSDNEDEIWKSEELFSPLVAEKNKRKSKKTNVNNCSNDETINTSNSLDAIDTNEKEKVETAFEATSVNIVTPQIVQSSSSIDTSENLAFKSNESLNVEDEAKDDPLDDILKAYKKAKDTSLNERSRKESEDLSEIHELIAAATMHLEDNTTSYFNQKLSQPLENFSFNNEESILTVETENTEMPKEKMPVSHSEQLSHSFKKCIFNEEESSKEIYNILYNEWEIKSHSNESVEISHVFAYNFNNVNGTGLVWLVTKKKNKHLLMVYPGHSFTQLPSSKTPVITLSAADDNMYVLLENGIIYRREGLDAFTPTGKKWSKFATKEIKCKPVWISFNASENIMWICDDKGSVWTYEINKRSFLKVDDTRKLVMKRVTVDPKNYSFVWALDEQNNVYVRQGIEEQLSMGTEWKFVMMVSKLNVRNLICANSTLWVLTEDRSVYRYCLVGTSIAKSEQVECPILFNDDVSDLSVTECNNLWLLTKSRTVWAQPRNNEKIKEDAEWLLV